MHFRPSVSRPRPGPFRKQPPPPLSGRARVAALAGLLVVSAAAVLLALGQVAFQLFPGSSLIPQSQPRQTSIDEGSPLPSDPWHPARVRLPVPESPAEETSPLPELSLSLVADAPRAASRPQQEEVKEEASVHKKAYEEEQDIARATLQPSAEPAVEALEPGPLRIRAVTFKRNPDGTESVSIEANGPLQPEVFQLDGKNPFGTSRRLVMDVKDVDSVAKTISCKTSGGSMVRRVRTAYRRGSRTFRAVLDLDPSIPLHPTQEADPGAGRFTMRLSEGPRMAEARPSPAPVSEPASEPVPEPASTPSAKPVSKPASTAASKQASEPLRAVLVRSIVYDAPEGTGERLLIQGDRFFEPTVFGLEGTNPYGENSRIVVDIPNARPLRKDNLSTDVDGPLVRSIRHHYHRNTQTLRLVLDLAPSETYEVAQAFYKTRNLYCLVLTDQPVTSDILAAALPDKPFPSPWAPTPRKASSPAVLAAAQTIAQPVEIQSDDAPPKETGLFRACGRDLSEEGLRAILLRHGFHSTCGVYNAEFCNPEGGFPNRFRRCCAGTVCDDAAGLMWQEGGSEVPITRPDALAYVRELNQTAFAGFRDWRLPTIEELLSLMEDSWRNGDLFVDEAFHTVQRSCWSSDTHGEKRAWKAQFHLGYARDADMDERNWVRAVRTLNGASRWTDSPASPGDDGTPAPPNPRRLVAR